MFGDDRVLPCLPRTLAHSLTAANQAGLHERIPRSRSLAENGCSSSSTSQPEQPRPEWGQSPNLRLSPPQKTASVIAGGHETRCRCYRRGIIVCGVVYGMVW